MPRTLFLHIGLPKTGSTALQETVFPLLSGITVRALPRSRMFDAAEDRAAGHRLFAAAFRRDPSVWAAHGEAIWDALALPDDGASLLVSEEGIGRRASRPDHLRAHLLAMKELARSHGFERLAVLAVIRRQADWLASHYAQMSNRKALPGQAGFERAAERILDPARDLHGFGTILRYDLLEEALRGAADEVLLLTVENMTSDRQAFDDALQGFLGISVPRSGASQKRNVRSGGTGTWRLRPPGLPLPGGARLRLPFRSGATIALTPRIEQLVAAAYGPANARLAERTGLPLAEYGYAVGC